ncbi:MAG: type II toxin-antitoxin system HicA family toxin [Phycisphaerae bacterium]|nr:type II toxin-antitoxin system HicA family toxin [Phycisphaerae bacterium]
MPELPVLTSRQVVQALSVLGFTTVRQRGSHLQMKRGNRLATVPLHRGDIPPGTLKSILRQAGITAQELVDSL